jgi:hypothetical protein
METSPTDDHTLGEARRASMGQCQEEGGHTEFGAAARDLRAPGDADASVSSNRSQPGEARLWLSGMEDVMVVLKQDTSQVRPKKIVESNSVRVLLESRSDDE